MLLLSSFKIPIYYSFQASNLIYHDTLFYSYLNKRAGSYFDDFTTFISRFLLTDVSVTKHTVPIIRINHYIRNLQ